MIPYLFRIFGPIYFNMYGFFVMLGVLAFVYLAERDRLTKQFIGHERLFTIILLSIALGIIGGRILYLLVNWHDFHSWYEVIALWDGGFSLLGSVLAIVLGILVYVWHTGIKVEPILDVMGTYGTLIQAISRLGCFCAGCCHGIPSAVPWAVTYLHPDTAAPRGIPLHPAQLYSAACLFLIFIIIRFGLYKYLTKPGQLFSAYLIGAGLERFLIDFIRADREFFASSGLGALLSIHQWIALCLLAAGLVYLTIASSKTKSYPFS